MLNDSLWIQPLPSKLVNIFSGKHRRKREDANNLTYTVPHLIYKVSSTQDSVGRIDFSDTFQTILKLQNTLKLSKKAFLSTLSFLFSLLTSFFRLFTIVGKPVVKI